MRPRRKRTSPRIPSKRIRPRNLPHHHRLMRQPILARHPSRSPSRTCFSSSTNRTPSFVIGHSSTRTTSSRRTESSVATNSFRKSRRYFVSRLATTGRQTSSSMGLPGRGSHSSRKPSARTSVDSVTPEHPVWHDRSQLPRPGYARRRGLRTHTASRGRSRRGCRSPETRRGDEREMG